MRFFVKFVTAVCVLFLIAFHWGYMTYFLNNRIYDKILDRNWFFDAYLSHHRRAITWVSNYRCPIGNL